MNLKLKGITAECFMINEDTVPADAAPNSWRDRDYGDYRRSYPSLRSIRFAAARHGADAVLAVKTAYDVRRYPNIFSFLYLTIIGMWIVPGSHREALYVYRGSLWDVGNEFLYATAEAEASDYIIRPFALADDDVVIQKARELAIEEFAKEVEQRIANLKGK